MKIKLLASSLVMAGALMASGSASAGVFASGTINDWINGTLTLFDGATQAADGTVTDADGDALFQYTGLWADGTTLGLSGDLSGFESDVLVTLSEFELLEGDNYSVDISYLPIDGVTGNGDYQYKITALGLEKLTSVSQDSTTVGSVENVKLTLSAAADGSGTFYTSNSFAGAPVPLAGHNTYAARSSLYATGLLTANNGVITATSDQFDVSIPKVPEPMTLALMGIGLAAFGARRRFS